MDLARDELIVINKAQKIIKRWKAYRILLIILGIFLTFITFYFFAYLGKTEITLFKYFKIPLYLTGGLGAPIIGITIRNWKTGPIGSKLLVDFYQKLK